MDKRSYIVLERNQNVLVSFPNLSYWKQIVSIWSRICSPGPNRNVSFDKTNSGTNSNVLVSFRLDIGTFVERLWNICSSIVLTLLNGPCWTTTPDRKTEKFANYFCHRLINGFSRNFGRRFWFFLYESWGRNFGLFATLLIIPYMACRVREGRGKLREPWVRMSPSVY